jgi:predicted DNA binding CopG/RHH family protein
LVWKSDQLDTPVVFRPVTAELERKNKNRRYLTMSEQIKSLKRQEVKKRVNLRLEPSLISALRQKDKSTQMEYQTMIRIVLWQHVNTRQ